MLVLLPGDPASAFELGEIAQRASVLYTRPGPSDVTRSALVDLTMAEAAIRDDRRLAGLQLVETCHERLRAQRLPRSVVRFLDGYSAVLRGRAQEDALEVAQAAPEYEEALICLGPTSKRAAERASVASHFADALVAELRPEDRDAPARTIEARMLPQVIIWALLGRARCATELPADDLAELWRRSRRLILRYGLPPDFTARLVAETAAAMLPAAGAEAVVSFFGSPPPEVLGSSGIAPSDLQSQVCAAVAHEIAREDEASLMARYFYNVALEGAARRNDPWTTAFTLGHYVGDFMGGSDSPQPRLEALIHAISTVSRTATVADKAALDPAVSVLLDYVIALWRDAPSAFGRLRVALALEQFSRPASAIIPSLSDLERMEDVPLSLQALWAATDWLGRIRLALRQHPRTGVIILHSGEERMTFLCLTPDDAEPNHVEALHEDLTTVEGLANAAAEEREFGAFAGTTADSPAFEAQCRAAYAELPQAVQKILRRHPTVLVVADVREDARTIPFELLDDGEGHLGATRVVAWLPSLRDTAFALEGASAPTWARRAIAAAAPRAPGAPPLLHAADEATHVRLTLSDRGWHAPPVREEEMTSTFIVDRLPHISVLHLSGHGTAAAGEEAFVLPQGRRLTAGDLGTARRPRMPFVYLNACHLGATRYVGGGMRKGLAHRLLELGAPAVISSRSPIDDQVAAALGMRFYAEAQSHPIGEALRRARSALVDTDVGAAAWSTTVLLGDPHVTLPDAADTEPDSSTLADRLLDALSHPDKDAAAVTELTREALRKLDDDPEDPRLDAAARLMAMLTDLDDREPSEAEAELRFGLDAAEQLGHPGCVVALRLQLAHLMQEQVRIGDAASTTARALPVLDALAMNDPAWRNTRLRAYGTWKVLDATERGEGILLPPDAADDSEDLQSKAGVTALAEAARRLPLRLPESDLDDLLWNAILVGHPQRFDRPRARLEVAGCLVEKLEDTGELPGSHRWAVTVLAGLLSYIWEGVTAIDEGTVQAAVQTLRQAVSDLGIDWHPPAHTWFYRLEEFRDTLAASADAVRRGEARESQLEHVFESWARTALALRREHAHSLPSGGAFALGSILELQAEGPADEEELGAYLHHVYCAVTSIIKDTREMRAYRAGWSQGDELRFWRTSDSWEDPHPPGLGTWF